jgi:predicted RNase H-like HicB family nuclease
MHRYLVVVEPAGENYSAYVPDLPGCVAAGDTRSQAESNIREAIKAHLDGLSQDGEPIPEGRSTADYIEV